MEKSINGDLRIVDFLSNFEPETRAQIIEFGKKISSPELKADVYLIMARKAICFVNLLLKFKLASLNGIIVSDRVLDTDLQWLKGKTITIIDDALVSGTTIRKVIDKLKTVIGQEKIKVYVLSVNSDWYKCQESDMTVANPYEMLVRTDVEGNVIFDAEGNPESYLVKPLRYQTNEKCMRTCFEIVKALSNTPMPYDVDFPLYEDLHISEKKLNQLLNSSWLSIKIASADYESDKNIKNGKTATETTIHSISFFPPKETVIKLINMFGIKSLSSGSLKIRTYVRERKKEHADFHVSFLPFTIINDLSNTEIDEILTQMIRQSEVSFENIENIFSSYTSKFRLIQYLISAVLAREFFANNNLYKIDSLTGQLSFPTISLDRLEYIFPQTAVPMIESMLEGLYNFNGNNLKVEFIEKKADSSKECLTLNPLIVFERLSDVFLQLYYNKEIRARELAKEYGYKVFERNEYKNIVNRLDEGKTFEDLLHTKIPINHVNSNTENEVNNYAKNISLSELPNAELIVSVFLDYAIDIGIAVPITYFKHDSVSRAYRHGEDVIFSDEEARLLAYMLYVFTEYAMPNKKVGGVLAEKLFCTFIKLGLEERIFNKYDYGQINSQYREYLKITYNLHGATVRLYDETKIKEEPKSYVTSDDTAKWLWEILTDKGLILSIKKTNKVDETGHYIKLSNDCFKKIENLRDTSKGISGERIAETLAYCYKNDLLSTDDLILLNATLGHAEIIPALLAEIEIIRNGFFIRSEYLLRNVFKKDNALTFLQSNRSGPVFTAMNSGKWKYEKFIEKFARNKVRSIKDTLSSWKNREIERNWSHMWQETLSCENDELPNEISSIILQEASFIVQFGLIYRILEYLAFLNNIGEKRLICYLLNLRKIVVDAKPDLKKEFVEKYLEESDKNILAYFKIIGIDKKINTKNIFDDNFIEKISKAEVITTDIKEYLKTLIRIDSLKPYNYSKELIDHVEQILDDKLYKDSYLNFILMQIVRLRNAANTLQKQANKYINNYGRIERPVEYQHVALIRYANEKAGYLKHDILNKIKDRQKKIVSKRNNSDRNDVDLGFYEDEGEIIVYTRGAKTDEALCRLVNEINSNLNIENDLEIFVFLNMKGECRPYCFISCKSSINLSYCKGYINEVIEEIRNNDIVLTFITLNNNTFCKAASMKELSEEQLSINGEDYKVRTLTKMVNKETAIKGFTIGIICAKQSELEGVKTAIANRFKISFADCLDSEENYRRYLQAEIIYEKLRHNIILSLCNQGNTGAAVAYDAMAHFKPDYVFFCGIAGSCNPNVEIGDVFIPFTIVDATLKKVTNDRIIIRGDAYKIPAHHIGLMQQFTDWCKTVLKKEELTINLYNEKAMSDNAVIACENSLYLHSILSVNDKAVDCVEMESAGLFDADYIRHKSKYGVYSIRGISDKANTSKNDSHHPLAINNASIVTSTLILFLIKNYDRIHSMKI